MSRSQLTCTKCGKTVATRPDRYDDLEKAGRIANYLCRDCKPKAEQKERVPRTPKTIKSGNVKKTKSFAKAKVNKEAFNVLDDPKVLHDRYFKSIMNQRDKGETAQEIDAHLDVLILQGEFGYGMTQKQKTERLIAAGLIKEEEEVIN